MRADRQTNRQTYTQVITILSTSTEDERLPTMIISTYKAHPIDIMSEG